MSKIIRYNRNRERPEGPNVFDLDTPSVLANPFSRMHNNKKAETPEQAVAMYRRYFDAMMRESVDFRKAFNEVLDAYCREDTIWLGCHCRPERGNLCHLSVIEERLASECVKRCRMEKERED